MATTKAPNINIQNKRASFEYELLDHHTAGIVLYGSEIKSIRKGKARITESFCQLVGGELFVVNMNVDEYFNATCFNHSPRRERKLLLERSELRRLEKAVKEKGLSIIPLRLFVTDKGLAKLNIALARGKKLYDKRDSIKEKDVRRDMDRALKV